MLGCKDVANTVFVYTTNNVMSGLGFAQADLSKKNSLGRQPLLRVADFKT
jgi:hypothetical protein